MSVDTVHGGLNSRESRDEARVVRKCLEGDRDAFSFLVEKYQGSVFNVIYRMVGTREETLDLTQEAFVRAFEGIRTFDARLPFGAWIYRVSVNVAIDYLRRKKLTSIPLDEVFERGEVFQCGLAGCKPQLAERDLPEAMTMSNETSLEVRDALGNLPEKYRAIIVLHHLEGMSYAEISRILGIPRSTAKTWARRGRLMLYEFLEGVI